MSDAKDVFVNLKRIEGAGELSIQLKDRDTASIGEVLDALAREVLLSRSNIEEAASTICELQQELSDLRLRGEVA